MFKIVYEEDGCVVYGWKHNGIDYNICQADDCYEVSIIEDDTEDVFYIDGSLEDAMRFCVIYDYNYVEGYKFFLSHNSDIVARVDDNNTCYLLDTVAHISYNLPSEWIDKVLRYYYEESEFQPYTYSLDESELTVADTVTHIVLQRIKFPSIKDALLGIQTIEYSPEIFGVPDTNWGEYKQGRYGISSIANYGERYNYYIYKTYEGYEVIFQDCLDNDYMGVIIATFSDEIEAKKYCLLNELMKNEIV